MSNDETAPTIKLDQFLKLVGVVGTGGQAKVLIQSGAVMVNGEVEQRRGRQLKLDDQVELDGEVFRCRNVRRVIQTLKLRQFHRRTFQVFPTRPVVSGVK